MEENFPLIIKGKSDIELKEIFLNQENFDKNFARLAEQELISREVDLTSILELREAEKADRLRELQHGKKGSPLYILFCFLLALVAGFIGIIGGYIYGFSTVKDADGNKHPTYEPQTRTYGKVIFFIGIASLIYAIWSRS